MREFTIKGTWKESRRTEEVTFFWYGPTRQSGDRGIVSVIRDAARARIWVKWQGIPLMVDTWHPLSMRAACHHFLNVTAEEGDLPDFVGDRDRYLFPTVVEDPGGIRKVKVVYPDEEAITGGTARVE